MFPDCDKKGDGGIVQTLRYIGLTEDEQQHKHGEKGGRADEDEVRSPCVQLKGNPNPKQRPRHARRQDDGQVDAAWESTSGILCSWVYCVDFFSSLSPPHVRIYAVI
jgi:hypothetical protein